MQLIKIFIKKNFQSLAYFYSYLKYRIFIAFSLSFFKGILDGFGLAMFIPLLKMTGSASEEQSTAELGNLSFLPEFFTEQLGISLNIMNVLIIILVFFGLKGIITFIEGYLQVHYQQLFMREIRITNIDLLNSYDYNSFVKSDVGQIQNTFSGEVQRVNMSYRSYFKSIEYGILIFVYVLLAFSANFQFALIVSVGGLLSNFVFKWLFKRTKQLSQTYTVTAHKFQSLLIQHVATFKYLKASGLNWIYGNKLKGNILQLEGLQKRIGIIDSILRAIREPITIGIVVLAIIIQITFFDPDIALIILSLIFLYRALTFLMAMQEYYNKFLSVSGSLDNMQEFTKNLRINKEKNGKLDFTNFNSNISLENVSFKYDNETVIDNLSLDIKKNETIAIIGESGSGKTTLMNILAGLFYPTAGNLFIDGVNIKDFNIYSFKNKCGYISQEAPIFNDTIFNNITFWADKTPENLVKFNTAIKEASIYDFIYGLADRENEVLGNNGINISGGQKQRLSIARELYKNVDFLFMDEATSALDGETESIIQKNIDQLRGKYTIVMIAHRLSTIKNADRIVLLKNGKINAIGSFQELLNISPVFEKMVALQEF